MRKPKLRSFAVEKPMPPKPVDKRPLAYAIRKGTTVRDFLAMSREKGPISLIGIDAGGRVRRVVADVYPGWASKHYGDRLAVMYADIKGGHRRIWYEE